MYLLIIGGLALAIGVLSGIFLARKYDPRVTRLRARAAALPMFQARPRPARAGWFRGRRAKKPTAAPITIRLRPGRSRRRLLALALLVAVAIIGGGGLLIYSTALSRALAQSAATVELAVQLPLSGEAAASGLPPSEGIELAVEEANASGQGLTFKLTTYDDQGSSELARGVADQIVASQALLVLGPAFSTTALATGPTFASADMVSLPTNATSDQITQNLTTFRVLFKNSDQGELLATYLVRVLGQKRAAVFVVDTTYGQTLREGFERAATALGVEADYYPFSDDAQAQELAKEVARNPQPPPVVLLTLDREGARILLTLRKLGVAGPFLGGDSFGKESFTELVQGQPEEQSQPGFFTDQLYALTPVILDSANVATLAFAERYRARYGHDPDWSAVSGYEAAILAITAARATAPDQAYNRSLPTRREAVGTYLSGLSRPEQALPGVLGPFWFDESRGRQLPIRVGRFRGGRLESAPVQIVTVQTPDLAELASGEVFELGQGRYARLQLVAHSGVYINEITQVDPVRSRFIADFYVWLRFAPSGGPEGVDPTDLRFPDMVSGGFERDKPVRRRVMEDGTEYRLWRVRGEFRGRFDMRRFPFDRPSLALAFVNAGATADQLVYAVDQQGGVEKELLASTGVQATPAAQATPTPSSGALVDAAQEAFRNLGEWELAGTHARRESLVADAILGDPARDEQSAGLELAGFAMTVELRRAFPAFATTVLPLLALSLLLFGSLLMPAARVRERVLIAVGVALCGLVPLAAINSQVGAAGSTIIIRESFYIYFGLALLCGAAALGAERARASGRARLAARIEASARSGFIIIVSATVVVVALLLWR